MNPYCCRCFTIESDPVETDSGCDVHWFKLDETGDPITTGVGEDGEISPMFTGIVGEHFDYDESYEIVCSSCLDEMLEEGEDEADQSYYDTPDSTEDLF